MLFNEYVKGILQVTFIIFILILTKDFMVTSELLLLQYSTGFGKLNRVFYTNISS